MNKWHLRKKWNEILKAGNNEKNFKRDYGSNAFKENEILKLLSIIDLFKEIKNSENTYLY